MKFAKKLYRGVFPKRLELDTKEKELLKQLYPTIDWNYVRCYKGMPWYMLKSFAIATALPHSYSGKYVDIYFRSYKPNTFISTCTLVHEAFHVLQYTDLSSMAKKSSGFGFFRPFVSYYLGWYFVKLGQNIFRKDIKFKEVGYHAYRYHQLEIPAYDYEQLFGEQFYLYQNYDSVYLLQNYPQLALQTSNCKQRPPIWAWLLASLITLVLTIVKPIADCLVLCVALVLGGRTKD